MWGFKKRPKRGARGKIELVPEKGEIVEQNCAVFMPYGLKGEVALGFDDTVQESIYWAWDQKLKLKPEDYNCAKIFLQLEFLPDTPQRGNDVVWLVEFVTSDVCIRKSSFECPVYVGDKYLHVSGILDPCFLDCGKVFVSRMSFSPQDTLCGDVYMLSGHIDYELF